MAYTPLRTDFKDDILDSSNYKRKYKQVANNDGTFSLQDETTYQQVGSDYGAKEVNEEREVINNIYENKLVALDDVALVTEEGFFVDALAVKELNSNLGNVKADLTKANNNIAIINSNLISIAERGTKNNYNYTKYSNGDMVMWSKYTWNTNLATSWYNWYFASSAAVGFPVAFKQAPLIIVSPAKTNELYGLGVTEVTTTGYKLTAYSPKQGMCYVQADMLIIGKWK